METYTDITYEVIEPFTHESFVTTDHYIALHHYEIGYNVSETHTTITLQSPFDRAQLQVVSDWKDDDPEP